MRILPLFLGVLLLLGCRTVRVVDAEGRPVADARVVTQTVSVTYGPTYTNANGEAKAPSTGFATTTCVLASKGDASGFVLNPVYPVTITVQVEPKPAFPMTTPAAAPGYVPAPVDPSGR